MFMSIPDFKTDELLLFFDYLLFYQISFYWGRPLGRKLLVPVKLGSPSMAGTIILQFPLRLCRLCWPQSLY